MDKQMYYFTKVVECNSFTEAAEQCYISQSAISQQIRALEQELGVALIHRENRKFSLTAAGEYFYRQSLILLDDIERLKRETIRISENNEQQLHISYLKGYGGQELHLAVAKFSEQHPEVSIHISNGTHEELYDYLRFGSVDLALSDQRRAFSNDYENHILVSSPCYVEVSTKSKLSALDYLSIEELRKLPCILVASKEQRENERDYYQITMGFGGEFIFAETLEEARLLVVGNQGIMPIEGVTEFCQIGNAIKRLPLHRNGHQIKRNYCAFWLKKRTTPYIETFADILKDVFKTKEIPSGD